MAPAHPTGTQHVPENVLDAAPQVLVQVLHHALRVPARQDNPLLGVVLQPLRDLREGVLGGDGGEGPCGERKRGVGADFPQHSPSTDGVEGPDTHRQKAWRLLPGDPDSPEWQWGAAALLWCVCVCVCV